MESLVTTAVPAGTAGILLALLIKTYWRQGSSWERLVGAERDAAASAREDAAAARAEVAALRAEAAACKAEIDGLRRRVAQLERGQA
jgi:cell division protein FtsB